MNVNPKGRRTGDCVVRALTVALNKSYEEVFDRLVAIAKQSCYTPNDKHTYEKLLAEEGFAKAKQPRKADNTKYTVSEIRLLTNRRKVVISVANHLTVVSDGVLVDTWNCSRKTIGNYYYK